MRIGKSRGSFLPVLMKLVQETTGPILELGVGFCSTPYLHWACYNAKRPLASYESNPEYYEFAESWKDDFHKVYCVSDWDNTEFGGKHWSIAFLDHTPGPRRGVEAMRLAHADYLVIHDSENRSARNYGLHRVFNNFKYRYKYTDAYPATSIWSNKHDVRKFEV
jgi:hypothetical protein